MRCENYFCVYWEDESCTVENIYLDILGCCQTCIYVDIPEDLLEEQRQKYLDKFERE